MWLFKVRPEYKTIYKNESSISTNRDSIIRQSIKTNKTNSYISIFEDNINTNFNNIDETNNLKDRKKIIKNFNRYSKVKKK